MIPPPPVGLRYAGHGCARSRKTHLHSRDRAATGEKMFNRYDDDRRHGQLEVVG